MSTENKNTVISRCEEKERIKLEKSVETELSLPDYCSDIRKILKCTLTAGIHSATVSGDRVNVKGTAVIRLIYVGEKDRTDCCEKTVELSVSGQCGHWDAKSVLVSEAVTDYVNCRAVSQRKVSLSGSVSIICRVLCPEKSEILGCADKNIETSKDKLTEEDFICHTEKAFDMSETVALDKTQPSIGKILRQHACVSVESKKAVDDKLLVKGELTVHCVYLSDDGECKIFSLTHKMPLSQIIDLEGIDETCEIRVDCRVGQLLLCAKADSSGAGRLIDVAARVSCYICGCKKKEYEYISDCYCTRKRHTPVYASRKALLPLYSAEKKTTLRQSIQLGNVKEICDLWAGECKTSVVGTDSGAKGRIALTVCILCLDEGGIPVFKEKELEFESDIPFETDCNGIDGCLRAHIEKLNASAVREGVYEITAEAYTDIRIYGVCPINYVCELKEQTDKSSEEGPALVIYYCDGGEKLWDIAKKYSAPMDTVREENSVSNETMKTGSMLFIPCG
ncbi:MAG: DUF3794 domain-containing protein [Clostridia bacterium]|nr:DUF3794 domain-containing protein [Clostridia bacterium]